MASDAELWPDLVARSPESALVPKPSQSEGGNSTQRLQGGEPLGEGWGARPVS